MSIEKSTGHMTGFESIEIPTEQVEDVVVALDEAFSHYKGHPDDLSCDCKGLHDRICHTEVKNLFEHYERHEVLTIDDLKTGIEIVLQHLEKELEQETEGSEEHVFIKAGQTLLKNRGAEIDRATRRYVQTVSKFFHIKKMQFRLEPQDFRDKFQEIDQIRRVAHNGLIETLTVYTRTINELQQYGALDGLEVTLWRSYDLFSEQSDIEGKVFVFAPEVLQNRDLVKDWAISAHLYNRLHEIEEMQKGAQTE